MGSDVVWLGGKLNEAVIREISPQRTGVKVFNQSFKRCEFANAAFPLTLDRVEVLVLQSIKTQCRVFDRDHRWRAGDYFAGFIVFGEGRV